MTPEEQLLWDIFSNNEKETKVTLTVEKLSRKSFPVDGVRITSDNIEEVANWCDGEIRTEEYRGNEQKFIKVRVHNALTERQTKGYIGDWVLYAGKGYKVYTDKALRKSFDQEAQEERNVFAGSEVPVSGGAGASGGDSSNPGGTHHG